MSLSILMLTLSPCRLLETIDTFSSAVNLSTGQSAQIVRTRVAVHVQEVNTTSFRGQTFTVNADLSSLATGGFQDDSIGTTAGMPTSDSTASLFLPPEILDSIANTNETRLAFGVFADDNLFQPRPRPGNSEVNSFSGSVIISASVIGYSMERFSRPVEIGFQKTQVSIC